MVAPSSTCRRRRHSVLRSPRNCAGKKRRGSASKPFHPLRGAWWSRPWKPMRGHMVSRWSHLHCSPTSVKPGGRVSAPDAKLTALHREEDKVTNTTLEDIAGRLAAVEERLARLETLLVGLT